VTKGTRGDRRRKTVTVSVDGAPIAGPQALGNTNGRWRFESTTLGQVALDAGRHALQDPAFALSSTYVGVCLWAENVAEGLNRTTAQLQAAFESSPGHFANIGDARFDEVGIGVAKVGNKIWSRNSSAPTAPEYKNGSRPGRETRPRGLIDRRLRLVRRLRCS